MIFIFFSLLLLNVKYLIESAKDDFIYIYIYDFSLKLMQLLRIAVIFVT